MKKILTALCLIAALALAAQTAQAKAKKPALTDEQKAVRKEIIDKYDTNKDGKLDAEEKAKISAEDKEKMTKAGLGDKKDKKKK